MITKEFGIDFNSEGGALTLDTMEVSDKGFRESNNEAEEEKTHKDGWTIKGVIHEDWYEWVNGFDASHPKYGRVWGDFEDKVFADTEEGFQHFYSNHEPSVWDYWDI